MSTVADTDLFIIDRGGVNYSLTALDLKAYIGGGGGGMNNVIYGKAATVNGAYTVTVSHAAVDLAKSFIILNSIVGAGTSPSNEAVIVDSRTTTSFVLRRGDNDSVTTISYFLVYA